MSMTRLAGFLMSCILAAPGAFASEPDTACSGIDTLVYSNSEIDLSICHGEYTKIDKSKLSQWQGCDDAIVQIRDKRHGQLSQYADCMANKIRQFKIEDNALLLNHFYTEYPGFDEKPLLIERLDLATRSKKYIFKKQFSACSKKDIDSSVRQIDSGMANQPDMKKYFDLVYGGLFKLRDCTKSDPTSALAAYKSLEMKALFDGEVAETFSELFEEVRLISDAIAQ